MNQDRWRWILQASQSSLNPPGSWKVVKKQCFTTRCFFFQTKIFFWPFFLPNLAWVVEFLNLKSVVFQTSIPKIQHSGEEYLGKMNFFGSLSVVKNFDLDHDWNFSIFVNIFRLNCWFLEVSVRRSNLGGAAWNLSRWSWQNAGVFLVNFLSKFLIVACKVNQM